MKLAGPPAMMEVLLLTNRPAPMIPPMEIIVKWRPFSERLSSYFGAAGVGVVVWIISYTLGLAMRILPCFDVDPRIAEFRDRRAAPQLPLADQRQRVRGMRTVELARQPMRIPQGLVELCGRLAVAGAEYVLNLVRGPLGLARLQLAPQPVIRPARGHQDDGIDFQVELTAIVLARDAACAWTREIGAVLVQIAQGNPAGPNLVDPMTAVHLHAFFEKHALVVEGLHREDTVLGDIGGVADVGHLLALVGHVLRERDSHEMSVAVEDQHALARHRLSGGDLEGRQHMGQGSVGTGNRPEIGSAAIAATLRTGRNDDAVRAISKNLIGRHFADAKMNLDGFFQLGELDLPVRDHPPPFAQPRQRRHGLPVAAQILLGFAKVHHIAALAQNARALHARGSAAHHQNRAGPGGLREFFRMPAAPVFLADGHVLRAHDLAALLEFRHADIAADALADVLEPGFGDLGRQERISDRGARGADDVEHARTDQTDHVVRAGEAAVADHGYSRSQDRLALLDEWRHPAGFTKA